MIPSAKTGVPAIGILFLALAVLKLINGDDWVVWAILGFLFGGFGMFANRSARDKSGRDKA